MVARAAANRAEALGVPFLCSSAVLDALTDQPARWVARLAPAQSYGWRIYADFLLARGHRRIAVARQASLYWETGTRVLRDHLGQRGGSVTAMDADALTPGSCATPWPRAGRRRSCCWPGPRNRRSRWCALSAPTGGSTGC